MENLTHPIIVNHVLNATLNATLYQPPQAWYYSWLKDWSPIILGIAQVVAALALAWLTKKLWDSTSQYSNQVAIQTDILARNAEFAQRTLEVEERNRQRGRLIKEMDNVIGPLYSRSRDQQIFNPVDVSMRYGFNSGVLDEMGYEASVFWQDNIARYKYLTSGNLRDDLEKYLKVKSGESELSEFENQNSPAYKQLEENLIKDIETRYGEIEAEMSILEITEPALREPSNSLQSSEEEARAKHWWQFWR